MSSISLKLDERTVKGKKVRSLRSQGFVPSIVYGGSIAKPIVAQSPLVETAKAAHGAGKHSPIDLMISGKKQLAMIKNIEYDVIRRTVSHISFHAIKQNEVIEAEVPIHLVGLGESAAEKAGLIVLQTIEHVDIKAKPADLPEALEVSIANLATDEDKILLGDVKLPKGVQYADAEVDPELVVANVYEPSALAAAMDASGGDAVDESSVEAENGSDTVQDTQAEESRPGGKLQDEPKQKNVDANK